MTRPSHPILLSHTDARWNTVEITARGTIYEVVYRGERFAMKSTNCHNYVKRMPTNFAILDAAERIARQLNDRFRTDQLTVRELA